MTKQPKKLTLKSYKEKFIICDKDYELAIAIGGDGSFLRMLKRSNFNSDIYYIGVNSGTLGFLQEIKPKDLNKFVEKLKNNNFKIEEIGIQETIIHSKNSSSLFYTLNEIVIRDKNLNTTKLNIRIDNFLLEKFVGDGILVSTSTGSTAYNLSYGGSIVYNTLHTLQITPIAPLNNKSYRSLLNSVVLPENKLVTIIPENKNISIIVSKVIKLKVIFLDVDGVLNHCDYKIDIIDPNKILLLKKLIDLTDAKIVLSSTWRRKYDQYGNIIYDNNYKILEKILKKYNLEIYSEIENIETYENNNITISIKEILEQYNNDNDRARYIVKWLKEHPEVESFVIIDDFGGWEKYNLTKFVVQTSYWSGGLHEHHINDATKILKKHI